CCQAFRPSARRRKARARPAARWPAPVGRCRSPPRPAPPPPCSLPRNRHRPLRPPPRRELSIEMLASVRIPPLATSGRAGLCSCNRQIRVNTMLTIVINLTFTKIRSSASLADLGCELRQRPDHQRRIGKRQQTACAEGDSIGNAGLFVGEVL